MTNDTAVKIIAGTAAAALTAITISYLANNVKLSKSLNANLEASKLRLETEKLVNAAAKRADQMIIDEIFDRVTKDEEPKD